MLISDIGEIVDCFNKVQKIDIQIDAAKAGKVVIQVNGANQGQEMAEALQNDVIRFLRSERASLVNMLKSFGFEE